VRINKQGDFGMNQENEISEITHRRLRFQDTAILAPVMKNSAKHLEGFIDWGRTVRGWSFKTVQDFVSQHMKDELPRQHFLFFNKQNELVGFGSLAPMPDPFDVQVALWVADGHHGKGIGPRIVSTLEWYAFLVFGYSRCFYQHDSQNRASMRLPQKLGYKYSHDFDSVVTAKDESGYWLSWVKERNPELPPGLLQGEDIMKWTDPSFSEQMLLNSANLPLHK
jgi:RimJ/RimL family protein N-acetyltransferase